MNRILIADDEKIVLMALKKKFESMGYQVTTAKNGNEASKAIQMEKFDVALLDIHMPYKNEFELIKDITNKFPEIITIVIAAYSSIENTVIAIKSWPDDYVNKSYDADLLVQTIESLVNLEEQKSCSCNTFTKDNKLIGESPCIQTIYQIIKKIKDLQTTILITGESGTGKGVIAKEIQKSSHIYKNQPLIQIDCGSLPANLIESELFGYEKGAFTGATETKKGKFELAQNGIIFLDEIGTLPLELQVKLLTVIQDRSFYRIGGLKKISVSARFIAATNDDLEESVTKGTFREDLFYRLNVIRIEIPPLRYRKSDIPLLASCFIKQYSESMGKKITTITDEFLATLQNYDWPGNIRELENAIECSIALSESEKLVVTNLPLKIAKQPKLTEYAETKSYFKQSLENQEIITIVNALEKFHGHRDKTADYLGITRRSLQYKLKKYNLLKEK